MQRSQMRGRCRQESRISLRSSGLRLLDISKDLRAKKGHYAEAFEVELSPDLSILVMMELASRSLAPAAMAARMIRVFELLRPIDEKIIPDLRAKKTMIPDIAPAHILEDPSR